MEQQPRGAEAAGESGAEGGEGGEGGGLVVMDDLRTCLICGAEEQPMTHCALCGNRPPLIESVRFKLKIIAEDLIAGFGDRTALLAKRATAKAAARTSTATNH